jgi:hypothetical protein
MLRNNVELTRALHSEQHIKTQLAKKVGQLQEILRDMKATMVANSQEACGLQGQQDQYLSHL